MKLLLVDDHALFREGMELVLRHLDPGAEVSHSVSVEEALSAIEGGLKPDLVLLDLHMPGMVGLDALLAMRSRAESTPVVVLSGSENAQIVWQAVDAGAMGFIQKQSNSHTMMAALRVVLGGGIYLPPICLTESGRRMSGDLAEMNAQDRIRRLGVSPRQAAALAKMVEGKPNKVIARELGITEATVKTHLSAAFTALDVHSRTEAVYSMAKLGLKLQDLQP